MPLSTRRLTSRTGLIASLVIAGLALAGCAQQQAPVAPIKVASAYVMQASGVRAVNAYFVIANAGSPDHLVAVHSSAGGKILMMAPKTAGTPATGTLPELAIPGHAVTRLDPAGMHLEILNPGPIHQGTDITLTLVFAHAGKLRVLAQVNNPQTGNSGYFGP